MSDVVPSRRRLSKSDLASRIRLIKGDITKQSGIDAIVVPVPVSLKADGFLHRAVMSAAGEGLDRLMLEHIYKPCVADVFVLPGFSLPVKSIIFVITPDWQDDSEWGDRDMLRCYRSVMEAGQKEGFSSIAIPAIGTGNGKVPVDRAARLAFQGIIEKITVQWSDVRIVCNRDETYEAFRRRQRKI